MVKGTELVSDQAIANDIGDHHMISISCDYRRYDTSLVTNVGTVTAFTEITIIIIILGNSFTIIIIINTITPSIKWIVLRSS